MRYSVFGIRPSKLLVQRIYPASSSFRACTLRLPSVVFSNRFRSANVSASFTASELMIASRSRSWMSRSRSGTRSRLAGISCGSCCLSGFRKAELFLATVPPCDDRAEHQVNASETRSQQEVSPIHWSEDGQRALEHEAHPHHGDHPHAERAAG